MMHENWLENTPSKMISIFMLRLVYKVDSDLFISKFPAEKKTSQFNLDLNGRHV